MIKSHNDNQIIKITDDTLVEKGLIKTTEIKKINLNKLNQWVAVAEDR